MCRSGVFAVSEFPVAMFQLHCETFKPSVSFSFAAGRTVGTAYASQADQTRAEIFCREKVGQISCVRKDLKNKR